MDRAFRNLFFLARWEDLEKKHSLEHTLSMLEGKVYDDYGIYEDKILSASVNEAPVRFAVQSAGCTVTVVGL